MKVFQAQSDEVTLSQFPGKTDSLFLGQKGNDDVPRQFEGK